MRKASGKSVQKTCLPSHSVGIPLCADSLSATYFIASSDSLSWITGASRITANKSSRDPDLSLSDTGLGIGENSLSTFSVRVQSVIPSILSFNTLLTAWPSADPPSFVITIPIRGPMAPIPVSYTHLTLPTKA